MQRGRRVWSIRKLERVLTFAQLTLGFPKPNCAGYGQSRSTSLKARANGENRFRPVPVQGPAYAGIKHISNLLSAYGRPGVPHNEGGAIHVTATCWRSQPKFKTPPAVVSKAPSLGSLFQGSAAPQNPLPSQLLSSTPSAWEEV